MSPSEPSLSHADAFLVGGGVMGELIRSKDWSATPLGSIESWPQSLRTAVSLCLASNFPIDIIWGPRRIQIYNDGYRPLCGAKHPESLGDDYARTWASAWDIIGGLFERVLTGQTSFLENQRVFLDRNGYLEESFFTFSFSPIRDESGGVGGVFLPVIETTTQMLSERRTRALHDLASRTAQSKSVEEACELSAQALATYHLDLPFCLLYLLGSEGSQARLVETAHLPAGTAASPETIEVASSIAWPVEEVMATGRVVQVNDLGDRFGSLTCGPYPESPKTALVLPISIPGTNHPAGILIAAVSPRLLLTTEYRAFLELAAAAVTAATVNARAYEEERKRAEKLAELDRAKTAFFSNVSHEFRTPLTLMLGPLEEMLSHPGEQFIADRESVDLVHRNALRLLRLVNTLLDFSRIEANRVQALYEPVDLSAFTRDLASVFRSATEKAGLTLSVDCPRLSEPIYVDREMWEKILFNLLSNAFKFTFHGTISLILRERMDQVELSVSDTGTGIPAHELPNLFKRFHRVQGAHGRTYEGTGIGLALVEDLVKLHGGSVQVESQLGVGTTFRVAIPKGSQHLPAAQVSRAPAGAKGDVAARIFVEEALHWLPETDRNGHSDRREKIDPSPGRRTGRIVLADDNADMRQYIRNILAAEFEIEVFPDGAQALNAIRETTPDLVITDVMMPELDGFGLLAELRNHRPTRAIPVIMLSARAGEEARIEGLQAGADDYLVKPFNARELVARARVNLELAHLRQKLAREEEERRGIEEMERQWRLFDTALSHIPDFAYMFDLEGRFTYANRALLDRWQKSISEAMGKNFAELGHPTELALKLQAQVQEVISRGLPLRDETSLPNSTGAMRHFEYVFVPVFSQAGQVEAVVGSTRDITEHRETNRALRAANADLEQFAFSASHDLQEPLRMVAIYSQLLKKKYTGKLDAQADMIIKQCVDSAVRMEQLIKDLLHYTRASAGPSAVPQPVSLEDVFDSTLESLRAAIEETNASIVRGSLPTLPVEAVHFKQVFQNLIGNALKYRSQRRPEIYVGARRGDGEWVISVRDNGIGIAPDYQEQIFGLFKRLHSGNQYSGTGLGLAICKKLIERYGGRIWLESELERGSTFYFTLPVREQA